MNASCCCLHSKVQTTRRRSKWKHCEQVGDFNHLEMLKLTLQTAVFPSWLYILSFIPCALQKVNLSFIMSLIKCRFLGFSFYRLPSSQCMIRHSTLYLYSSCFCLNFWHCSPASLSLQPHWTERNYWCSFCSRPHGRNLHLYSCTCTWHRGGWECKEQRLPQFQPPFLWCCSIHESLLLSLGSLCHLVQWGLLWGDHEMCRRLLLNLWLSVICIIKK